MQAKIRYLLICVILLLTLILGVACVPAPNFSFSSASLSLANRPSNDVLSPVDSNYPPEISEIINKLRPAVVSIDVELTANDISGDPVIEQLAASGWILNQDGLIVTNSHVVEGAKSVTVTLEKGQAYNAKTIRTDPVNDLAVIDIGIGSLAGIALGDSSSIHVGDPVIALGNAFGEEIRATRGIISSTSSTFVVDNRETLYNMLETTALIVHGNSGGPLVNMDGEVIGIVTGACLTRTGTEVAGYAISSGEAGPIIHRLTQE